MYFGVVGAEHEDRRAESREGDDGAGDGRADEAEEDEQPGPEPGFLFLPRAPRRDGGVWQDNTFFSRFGCK